MLDLIRFWFTFNPSPHLPSVLKIGCGITAYTYDDALFLLKKIYTNINSDDIKDCVENIDLKYLDQNHILPNIGIPHFRGIWFPLIY